MKKTLLKTEIGLLALIALLILFASHRSFAGSMDNTLCSVIVDRNGTPRLVRDMGGQWINSVLVFSNKNSNVYTGEDTITGNLFWGNLYGDFLGTGNFRAQLYIEIKDKKMRKKMAEVLKSDILKQPSLAMIGHPDLFTYSVYYAFFDMKNNVVSLKNWEKYLDRDGDLIMLKKIQEDVPLDKKTDFKLIANGIISALNKAKSDPKTADKIRKIQQYGNNMTDVSRKDALRNSQIARGQKAMPIGESMYIDKNPDTIEHMNEIIRLRPDYDVAYSNRGRLYHKMGQYQQAIKDFDEAIRLNPNSAEAYNNRGYLYKDLGQSQQAIKDFEEAIRLNPDEAAAYNGRGSVYINLGQSQQAIKDFEEAIRLKPAHAGYYVGRGFAYDNMGHYQLAIKDFEEAIRLKPDEAAAYNGRGATYNKLGQTQRAITDLNEAIRLEPDYDVAYYNRGNAYINLRQFQQAIKDYDESIRLKPYAVGYNSRGLAYILYGNKMEGCRSLARACELKYCKDYDLSKQKGDCP